MPVTAGCWVQHGSAGCLFQHAYWQGVREGVFADAGRPGDWIGSFVGPRDYGLVIRVIDAFDRLARSQYSDIKPRALLPDRVLVRQRQSSKALRNTHASFSLVRFTKSRASTPIAQASSL